jgi:extradiol dioxygenase family protein
MKEGKSSDKLVDYDFYGIKMVCHFVGKDYRAVDYVDQVGGEEVPVPHFGAYISL